MPLAADLLEIVRCPKCRGRVTERSQAPGPGLVCEACRLLFPIVDDVPNFLIEEARPLSIP